MHRSLQFRCELTRVTRGRDVTVLGGSCSIPPSASRSRGSICADGKINPPQPRPHFMWARPGAGGAGMLRSSARRRSHPRGAVGVVLRSSAGGSNPPSESPSHRSPQQLLTDTLAHQALWPGPWHHVRRRNLDDGVYGITASCCCNPVQDCRCPRKHASGPDVIRLVPRC